MRILKKTHFDGLAFESSLTQSGEYSVKMIDQLLRCSREDVDIIQVTNTDAVV